MTSEKDADGKDGGEIEPEINEGDVPDGFFSVKKGSYKPREFEVKDWGPTVGIIQESHEPKELIFELLKRTSPCSKWRTSLKMAMRSGKSEVDIRKSLHFLNICVHCGETSMSEGNISKSIQIEANSAPSCLTCVDWLGVMEGLEFETTCPGSVRDICDVDVSMGSKTDIIVLQGFCCLIKSVLGLSWTNLSTLPQIQDDEGRQMFDILYSLCEGFGIDNQNREMLRHLESRYPYLMTSLGFKRGSEEKLQWENPMDETKQKEFQNLYCALFGLFGPTEDFQTSM